VVKRQIPQPYFECKADDVYCLSDLNSAVETSEMALPDLIDGLMLNLLHHPNGLFQMLSYYRNLIKPT
jgi:hypothetical protein